MVASAVYFKNGLPEKSLYRKFNIKTIEGHSNDPAAIGYSRLPPIKPCLKRKRTFTLNYFALMADEDNLILYLKPFGL